MFAKNCYSSGNDLWLLRGHSIEVQFNQYTSGTTIPDFPDRDLNPGHSVEETYSIRWLWGLFFSSSVHSVHMTKHNSWFPWPGIEPGPRRWERRILATRPSGTCHLKSTICSESVWKIRHLYSKIFNSGRWTKLGILHFTVVHIQML